MRWLVIGSGGMLGADLVRAARRKGHEVTAALLGATDLFDPEALAALVADQDVVVNCATWTSVDEAEEQEAEALRVNAVLPDQLARAVAESGGRLVQLSSEHVFDGTATQPYAEDAPTAPVTAYGRTRAAGEEAVRLALPDRHWVVRTAWLYGAHGACFPRVVARAARERGEIAVVRDQVGQPTWSVDVADLLLRLVAAAAPAGTYHATASGQCTWFDLAREVVAALGLPESVVRETTSAELGQPAPRPAYSVLGHDALVRAGVAPVGDWRDRWRVAASSVLAV